MTITVNLELTSYMLGTTDLKKCSVEDYHRSLKICVLLCVDRSYINFAYIYKLCHVYQQLYSNNVSSKTIMCVYLFNTILSKGYT